LIADELPQRLPDWLVQFEVVRRVVAEVWDQKDHYRAKHESKKRGSAGGDEKINCVELFPCAHEPPLFDVVRRVLTRY
jgi:hypothetical protein